MKPRPSLREACLLTWGATLGAAEGLLVMQGADAIEERVRGATRMGDDAPESPLCVVPFVLLVELGRSSQREDDTLVRGAGLGAG